MSEFTLVIDDQERSELLRILERALGEARVEAHHTHTPDYREEVQQEEALLRGLLQRVRRSSPAVAAEPAWSE